MKTGWKTTEFWAAIAVALGSLGDVFPEWAGPAAGMAYVISRGLAKVHTP